MSLFIGDSLNLPKNFYIISKIENTVLVIFCICPVLLSIPTVVNSNIYQRLNTSKLNLKRWNVTTVLVYGSHVRSWILHQWRPIWVTFTFYGIQLEMNVIKGECSPNSSILGEHSPPHRHKLPFEVFRLSLTELLLLLSSEVYLLRRSPRPKSTPT